jgi:hypothetical protein
MISKRLPKLGFDGSWVLVNLIKGLSAHHQITLLSFMETEEEKTYAEHLSLLLQRGEDHHPLSLQWGAEEFVSLSKL